MKRKPRKNVAVDEYSTRGALKKVKVDSVTKNDITLPVDDSLHQQQEGDEGEVASLIDNEREDIFQAALNDIILIVNNSEEKADTIYYKV